MNPSPLPPVRARRARAAREILPTKRQYRARSLLATLCAVVLLPSIAGVVPAFALNEPQLRQSYPRDLGRVRSINAAELRATFDRDLHTTRSTFTLTDNALAVVPGATTFDDISATGGSRTIIFAPTGVLSDTDSPYTASVHACSSIRSVPCNDVAFSFFIDDTAPPMPTITDPLSGQYRTDQPVLLRGTAEAGAQILVAEDMDPTNIIAMGTVSNAGSFIIPLPYGPEDGVDHTVRVYARDEATNDSAPSADVTFTHDSVLFRPIITSPFAGQVFATSTIPVAGLAKAGSAIEVEDGGPVVGVAVTAADKRWSTSISAAEGTHTITASADDGFVVDGPSNAVTFIVDLTAPVAPIILTPTAGSFVRSETLTVSGTAEPNAKVRVSEGATLLAEVPVGPSGSWSATLTLPEGAHTLTAVAVDAAGNLSPSATVSFTVDTVPPVRPLIVSPAEGEVIPTSTFAVDGKAEAGSLVRLYEGTALVGTDVATPLGDWMVAGLFADGAHDLLATAEDAAGNVSAPSPLRHFGVDTLVPDAPEIRSPVTGEFTGRAEVLVSGISEPNAGITVVEASLPLGIATAGTDGTWTTQISFTNGTHTIEANATDLAGNVGPDSPSVVFDVVLPAIDTTPPSAPTITSPAALSTKPGFVLVKGTSEAGATVRVFEGSEERGSASVFSGGAYEVGITFTVSGSHTITVRATDTSGNQGPASVPRTFTVDAVRPTVTVSPATLTLPGTGIGLLTPTEPEIAGGAADNFGVARIEVEFTNRATGASAGTLTAYCTGCPGTSVTWDDVLQTQPGIFQADAYAVDLVGNRSLPTTMTFITLGLTT